MNPRIGSLFAGYGGLEMGVSSVLGGRPAWFSEIEPAPSRILAHHWPDVPNLGDVTAVDWGAVEPVDVLTGGFPCQDVSHAGKRLGLKPGTRSGLWSHMAYAIDKLRPGLVVAENVRGLLSAEAGGDLEPCPWCVGDGERGALRALGAVLGDLADLGYDAQWVGVRASDAGAPHGRFRVFVFAWPAADTQRGGVTGERIAGGVGAEVARTGGGRGTPADADRLGHQRPRDTRGPAHTAAADADGAARGERRVAAPGQTEGGRPRTHPRRRGGTPPADTDVTGREGREPAGRRNLPARGTSADTDRSGREARGGRPGTWHARRREPLVGSSADSVAWGDYEPAIRRWEHLTRPAPPPTEISQQWLRHRAKRFSPANPLPVGRRGSLRRFLRPEARLSPAFVEWMQGLPAGHVTAVPGLTRNDQLKALGNGVVPQQAALATHIWAATMQGTYPTATTQNGATLLPTPTAASRDRTPDEAEQRVLRGWPGGGGPDLSSVAALLPTPDANMGNGGRTRSEAALREGNRQTNLDDLPRVLTMQPEPTGTDDGRLW